MTSSRERRMTMVIIIVVNIYNKATTDYSITAKKKLYGYK